MKLLYTILMVFSLSSDIKIQSDQSIYVKCLPFYFKTRVPIHEKNLDNKKTDGSNYYKEHLFSKNKLVLQVSNILEIIEKRATVLISDYDLRVLIQVTTLGQEKKYYITSNKKHILVNGNFHSIKPNEFESIVDKLKICN